VHVISTQIVQAIAESAASWLATHTCWLDTDCLTKLAITLLLLQQIRGYLSHFTQVTPSSEAFDCCTACGAAVVQQWQQHGFNFVQQVCSSNITPPYSCVSVELYTVDIIASISPCAVWHKLLCCKTACLTVCRAI
jgi:hypothetical protein